MILLWRKKRSGYEYYALEILEMKVNENVREVWSVKCEVWSVKCEVWSVKCEV